MDAIRHLEKKTCLKSLFDLCIELVAKNLDLVENFHGFPSLIGEKIFKCAVEYDKFSGYSYARVALKLFTEAFGGEILSSINVCGQHLGINFYLEQLLIFHELVEIDLSHCGLGDHHEILTHISTMKSLQKLVLCNNALSDQGIQKLTTPSRMFQKGPQHLSFIDLNGNDVSLKCLKFMTCFKDLCTVVLPCRPCGKKETVDNWKVVETAYKPAKITTRGWAADVINNWMCQARTKVETRCLVKKPFYSRPNLKEIGSGRQLTERLEEPVTSLCLLATRIRPSENQRPTDGKIVRDIGEVRTMITKNDPSAKHDLAESTVTELSIQSDAEMLHLYKSDQCIYKDKNALVKRRSYKMNHYESASDLSLLHGLDDNDEMFKKHYVPSNFRCTTGVENSQCIKLIHKSSPLVTECHESSETQYTYLPQVEKNSDKGFQKELNDSTSWSNISKHFCDGPRPEVLRQSRKRKWLLTNSVSDKSYPTNHSKSFRTPASSKNYFNATNDNISKCDRVDGNLYEAEKEYCISIPTTCESESCDNLNQSSGTDKMQGIYDSYRTEYQDTTSRLIKKRKKIKICRPEQSEKQLLQLKKYCPIKDQPKVSNLLNALDSY